MANRQAFSDAMLVDIAMGGSTDTVFARPALSADKGAARAPGLLDR